MTNRLLSPSDVAAWLTERGFPMSAQGVRALLKKQGLPGSRIGTRWVTAEADLEAWLHVPIAERAPMQMSEFVHRRKEVA
jgi:hypothetical protein